MEKGFEVKLDCIRSHVAGTYAGSILPGNVIVGSVGNSKKSVSKPC